MKNSKTKFNLHAAIIRKWMNELRYYSWCRKPLDKDILAQVNAENDRRNKLEYKRQREYYAKKEDAAYRLYQRRKTCKTQKSLPRLVRKTPRTTA